MQRSESSRRREGEIECDEVLFERLRELRKRLADERNVPAYQVFSDVTLRYMAREYPTTPQDFARISGVGERKRADFGHVFTAEVSAHLEEYPQQTFASLKHEPVEMPRVRSGRLTPTVIETLEMFWKGMEVSQIAARRGFVDGTIFTHLATAIECGKEVDIRRLFSESEEREIAEAVKKFGWGGIPRAVEEFGGRYGYGHFKVYRAFVERMKRVDK